MGDYNVDPYLFPARGRKHALDALVFRRARNMLIPTFSPQGDGNSDEAIETSSTTTVDPYLFPARGRKRLLVDPADRGLPDVDPYLFPARGRKRPQVGVKFGGLGAVDPYLFPARGRKPLDAGGDQFEDRLLIPTFSPQGDGNGEFGSPWS